MLRLLAFTAGFWLLLSGVIIFLHGDRTAGRLIAYSAEVNGNREIFIKTPDGQYIRRLTYSSVDVWSPDGKWIAFASRRDGIYITRPNSKKLKRVGNLGTFLHELSWSPDSQWLSVFTVGPGSNDGNRRYMVNINTGQTIGLNNLFAHSPIWSNNAEWMLVSMDRADSSNEWLFGTQPGLIRVRPDGSDYVLLRGKRGIYPVISPDNQWVAFQHFLDGETILHRMRIDGSDFQVLTGSVDIHTRPEWSPDNQHIAFIAHSTLYRMQTDGRQLTPLLEHENLSPHYLEWSPDSEWLLFYLEGGSLYKIRADGSDLQKLTLQCGAAPEWLPEGDYIVFRCGFDVYWMHPDGSNVQHLGNENFAYVDRVSWSPIFDGNSIK